MADDVRYLRFYLHADSDGQIAVKKKMPTRSSTHPVYREFRKLFRILVTHGIRKVRLVGGDDPALREDLADVVAMVASVEGIREVAITTRGVGLAGRMETLTSAGMSAVNFNIDTFKPDRFKAISGSDRCADAWAAVDDALSLGLRVKLNVVAQRGVNDDEVVDFVNLTQRQPVQVRFVEWNSDTEVVASPDRFLSTAETMAAIKPPLVPRSPSRLDGPALVYDIPEHKGSIGFIPNVTEHFCSRCGRIGLTDQGEILSCIFGKGLSLVRHLRSPGGVAAVSAFVDRVLRRKVLLASKLEGYPVPPAKVTGAAHVSA